MAEWGRGERRGMEEVVLFQFLMQGMGSGTFDISSFLAGLTMAGLGGFGSERLMVIALALMANTGLTQQPVGTGGTAPPVAQPFPLAALFLGDLFGSREDRDNDDRDNDEKQSAQTRRPESSSRRRR